MEIFHVRHNRLVKTLTVPTLAFVLKDSNSIQLAEYAKVIFLNSYKIKFALLSFLLNALW